jgi:hypothetical protein
MAGRTLEEACATQAHSFPRRNPHALHSAHLTTNAGTDTTLTPNTNTTTTTTSGTPVPNNIVINGVTYAFVLVTSPTTTEPPKQLVPDPAPLNIDPGGSWEALIAFDDTDSTKRHEPDVQSGYTLTTNIGFSNDTLDATPFVLDTGATCHISLV